MTRREAVALLAAGLALIVAGLVWLFGPYGLIGAGVLLAAGALFGAEVRDSAEAVDDAPPVRGPGGHPVSAPRPV